MAWCGWQHPDLSVSWDSLLYESYRQCVNGLESGREFKPGRNYTVASFQKRCVAKGRAGTLDPGEKPEEADGTATTGTEDRKQVAAQKQEASMQEEGGDKQEL